MIKKKMLYIGLPILALCAVMSFQNCAQNSDSTAATKIGCDQAGISGTWQGNISGNSDSLIIASNCAIASTYCSSNSSATINEINKDCPSGSNSCGVALVTTNSTNGYQGCLPQSPNVTCAFVTYNNSRNLVFNCGNSSVTYSR